MQPQSRTVTGLRKDDSGGFNTSVSPFRVVLSDYFKPLKNIHRNLDDEASIAVAGRYEDISDDETTIWLRLTVQRTAGLFTMIILKVKLPDPSSNSDLEVTRVHPLADTPLSYPVDVGHEITQNWGMNLGVTGPPPAPISAGGNVAKGHKLSYTLPKYPMCSAGLHTSGAEEVCKWVLQGEETFTYGVAGNITHMGITLKLPQDLGPRQLQASFQFQFDYIQTDRKWYQLTSRKHSDVFPSRGEYRILTFDLGSRKSENKREGSS